MDRDMHIEDVTILTIHRMGNELKVDLYGGDGYSINDHGETVVARNVRGTLTLEYDFDGEAIEIERRIRPWADANDPITLDGRGDFSSVTLTNQRTRETVHSR